MSWRMHIVVVNTDKAQTIRILPAEHYEKLADDWVHVQAITCDYCEDAFKKDCLNRKTIEFIESELKANDLAYDKQKLLEFVRYISDGHFKVDEHFECDFTSFNHFVDHDMGLIEDYCLGRFDEIPKDIGNPFYIDENTQKLFEYYNPRVIHKKDFESIIEMWRKLIIENYKEILMDPAKELRWRGHIEAKIDRWEFPHSEPYNMDEKYKEIVRAYDLEYRIFDLVRLYKSIDWMRDTVILFGW